MITMIELIHLYDYDREWVMQPHEHPSDEMTLVLEGGGFLFTPDGQSIPLAKGTLLLIPHAARHGCIATKPISLAVVCFFKDRLTSFNKMMYEILFGASREMRHVELDEEQLDTYMQHFAKLNEELHADRPFKEEAVRIELEALFLAISRNYERAPSIKTHIFDAVLASALEIERCYTEDIKIEELAAQYYLSNSYFRKVFKEIIGLSPKQYLIQVRLEVAKRLLVHTDKNLTTIAEQVGFASVHQFIATFSEKEQMTPTDWRRTRSTSAWSLAKQ